MSMIREVIINFRSNYSLNIGNLHRYINHGSAFYNLVVMKPVMVGEPPSERLRFGFVARRSIARGEELFFNDGVNDKDLPWLTTNAHNTQGSSEREHKG